MKRDKAIQTINELHSEFDIDELIEKSIFIEKIEKGLKEADEGKTISHEQLKDEIKKW